MLVVCRAATVTLLSVEIEANVLVNRQLATMLISAGYNHAGPGHRQVLDPVIDELAADVADALGRRPDFGDAFDGYLAVDRWGWWRAQWLTTASETLMILGGPQR